jgi:hypothetical protein
MEFDPAEAVDQWYFSCKTIRHVHAMKDKKEIVEVKVMPLSCCFTSEYN